MRVVRFCLMMLAMCWALPAHAQVNGFTSFGASATQYTQNNNGVFVPTITSGTLRSTNGQPSTGTAVWYNTAQPAGDFRVQFSYTAALGSTSQPADGVAFVMQRNAAGLSALGSEGGFLGFGGLDNTVGYCINLFGNRGTNIFLNGEAGSQPYNPPLNGVSFSSLPFTIDVTLLYTGGVMTETVVQGANSYTRNYNVDIQSILGDTTGFVGFTGGTGGLDAIQDISNFSMVSVPEPSSIVLMSVGAMGGVGMIWRRVTTSRRKRKVTRS
jgi:hypothetical protein